MKDARLCTAQSLLRALLRRVTAAESHPRWDAACQQVPGLAESFELSKKNGGRGGLGYVSGRRPDSEELGRIIEQGEALLREVGAVSWRLETLTEIENRNKC